MANVLYRMFDADDRLLYVGISSDPGRRVKQHSKEKDWWEQVDRLTLEHFPDRSTLEHAEAKAIRRESPVHNKVRPSGARRGVRRYHSFDPVAHERQYRQRRAKAGRYFITTWKTCPATKTLHGTPNISGPVWGQIIGRVASQLLYVTVYSHVSGDHAVYHIPLAETDHWDFVPPDELSLKEFFRDVYVMGLEYRQCVRDMEAAA